MKRPHLAFFLTLGACLAFAGCGAVGAVEQARPLQNQVAAVEQARPLQSQGDRLGRSFRHQIYILSLGAFSPSVAVFDAAAHGDVPPLRDIAGAATKLAKVWAVAVDANGREYVSCGRSVRIFAADANGNVPPVASIEGPLTGLGSDRGLYVDSAGATYVVADNPARLEVFAPGATGNVAPSAVIEGSNTRLKSPDAVTVGPDGTIYVTTIPGRGAVSAINEYPPGANGNVAPIVRIAGGRTDLPGSGVALDAQGNIYSALWYFSEVIAFAAGSSGDVAPTIEIAGSHTKLEAPQGTRTGVNGDIYVVNQGLGDLGSVTVYAAGSNGDVSPKAVIKGASTLLSTPDSIAYL